MTIQSLTGGLVILTFLYISFKSWKALQKIGFYPGFRTIIGPESLLSDLIGSYIPYVSSGRTWTMKLKYEPFRTMKRDVLSWFQVYPMDRSFFIVSDPYAVKEIVSNRARFPKQIATYKILEYFGSNILTTEGEQWKHQRKLTAPTFSERNNRLVWEETIRVIQDMFDNQWGRENKEVPINHCLEITLPITLMVLSGAGFGRRISWAEDRTFPPGHTMPFKNALYHVCRHMILISLLPKWCFSLSKKLRVVYQAKDELLVYMKEMIEQRRENLSEERYDLLNALLKVNEVSTKDEGKLGEDELLGNIFIFLLAGHETTAHTTCFALGLLALEQEEQEKLYRHIESVLDDRDIPYYEEFNTLTYVMAVINETLRLFPPVTLIPKETSEDVLLPMVSPDGRIETLAVQKGTGLVINTVGLHYNPRYWDSPDTFNPSRFLGDYNRDAFMPFSAGARACIGRGFGETEMVAALTMIIRRYKVELKNPEHYAGMNKLQQREKLLANRAKLTLTPLSVPLVFKKRSLLKHELSGMTSI